MRSDIRAFLVGITVGLGILRTGTAATISFVAIAAQAQENAAVPDLTLTLRPADPNEQGDGTLSPAAKEAIEHGPLPFSDADVAAKAAKTRARLEARQKSGALPPLSPIQPTMPVIVGGFNNPGQTYSLSTPSDSTGAIGPSSFVQLVNKRAGIYDRGTGSLKAASSLNDLAGIAASVNSFDPQVIWDATTNRFYYTMDSVFSTTDNRLEIGFSKTSDPKNLTTDWCHYDTGTHYGPHFPDYPKLGDSQFFAIIGVNVFKSYASTDKGSMFLGSDLIAISKPPAGTITTCPSASTLKTAYKSPLVDSSTKPVFTPVPATQIDTYPVGYVVARNGILRSNQIWFFSVTQDATGKPIFGSARGASGAYYDVPPWAFQPGTSSPLLDTQDARFTQAVQAFDPRLGTFSFWTQHTVDKLTPTGQNVAEVRYYEIDPVPTSPMIKSFGEIFKSFDDYFNAAISPDRAAGGKFGNNFVIQYNHVSADFNIYPDIEMASNINGATGTNGFPLLTYNLVKAGVGPYKDYSCPNSVSVCRWGDYAAATPDPYPTTTDRGVVWGTNQFSGVLNPQTNIANWRTQIFAVKP
jgi:hypothetical protein